MGTVRKLTRPPHMLTLYLRAAAALVPGASRLPGVPGAGKSIPELELTLPNVAIDRARLAAFCEVCGFAQGELVACTYPHVLAFPLHMALMTDPQFPFGAVGLVHVRNEIRQSRPLQADDALSFAVRATAPEPHPRGRTFAILTTASAGGELVWSERSTVLRRERSPQQAEGRADGGAAQEAVPPQDAAAAHAGDEGTVIAGARWTLAGDIGRRYGAVSGDRNPIHMHALSAKAFGFQRAIAHGMWTKSRCLAALEDELPEAFTLDVRFRKPVMIPGSVSFEADRQGDQLRFALRSPSGDELHLAGELRAGVQPTAEAAQGAQR